MSSKLNKYCIWYLGHQCLRCEHPWIPKMDKPVIRSYGSKIGKMNLSERAKAEAHFPKVCPNCKSPYWNKPKRK